jgi:hypothetical protein
MTPTKRFTRRESVEEKRIGKGEEVRGDAIERKKKIGHEQFAEMLLRCHEKN